MEQTKVRHAGGSDPGRVRRNNEDAWYADAGRGIFLVVDGLGGQNAGEKAAEIAVERVRARLERQTGAVEQRLREAIAVANNEILRAARSNPEWEGMACVLTAAVIENGFAVVGHVGDSRLYKIHHGEISKKTHDHSPVGEREDSGELTEAEAMRHPRRNEVYRDVGSEEHAPDDPDFVEVSRIPFDPDCALVLCSDGLSDQVPSGAIRSAVERHARNPEAAVRELVDAANAAGGKDNVTVLVIEGEEFIGAAPAPAPAPAVPKRGRLAYYAAGAALLCMLSGAGGWFSHVRWGPHPTPPSPPAVLKVGQGGPFPSIEAALQQARPGDTVEVGSGEYNEPVALKTGVEVRSSPPGAAILRASPLNGGPAVTALDVRGARLTGFRILAGAEAPLSAGIVLTDSSVTVEEVEIAGAGTGIEIRGAASPVLRADSIHDCAGPGILVSGLSQPWISHNAIRRNKVGVAAGGGARPVLIDNVFEKNGVDLPPGMSMDDVRAHNSFIDVKFPRAPAAAGRGPSAPPAGRAGPSASQPAPASREGPQP
jgi:serine/threonine protein phosphatase PrpC